MPDGSVDPAYILLPLPYKPTSQTLAELCHTAKNSAVPVALDPQTWTVVFTDSINVQDLVGTIHPPKKDGLQWLILGFRWIFCSDS